jgi:hypothetical protein
VAILIPSFSMVNLLLYHHCIWDLSLMWLCPSSRKVMYHQVLDRESSSPRTSPGVLSTKVRDQGSTHAVCMGTLDFSRGPRLITRPAKEEENPFVPPPVDLDKIPLVDKDSLVADTACSFDFADLQSWLRQIFLDQSDEIGLWESNLPLYLFPQVHHFPELALKCQAHYIPEQKAIVSSLGDVLFFITPEDIDQMM